MGQVRVLVAGICRTDLELLRGYYGFSGIPGRPPRRAQGPSPALNALRVGALY